LVRKIRKELRKLALAAERGRHVQQAAGVPAAGAVPDRLRAADIGRHDADVQILDRLVLGLAVLVVIAARELAHQARKLGGERGLLLFHRGGRVDHEQHIDDAAVPGDGLTATREAAHHAARTTAAAAAAAERRRVAGIDHQTTCTAGSGCGRAPAATDRPVDTLARRITAARQHEHDAPEP
jgi:hypothetical protein